MQIDFAIIGAPKSGTTSLYDFFSNVGDLVAISDAKDFPVFSRPNEIGDRLISLKSFGYKDYSEKPQIIGDVNICLDKTNLQALCELAPFVRLILLVRQPRDRILSAHAFNSERLLESRTIYAALNDEANCVLPEKGSKHWFQKSYFLHSDYEKMIANCLSVFNEDQLLVLDFDDLVGSFSTTLQYMADFMDCNFNPDSSLPSSNVTSGRLRFQFLSKILFQGQRSSIFWQFLRKGMSQAQRSKIRFWLRRVMRAKAQPRIHSKLDDEKLTEAARQELHRLEKNYRLLKNQYKSN
ncbi:sulfotransferase domain-containing protein [Octadecabacter sp.]|nr:sulfotransferase domain-containing protein [Octadecabacter sp.]